MTRPPARPMPQRTAQPTTRPVQDRLSRRAFAVASAAAGAGLAMAGPALGQGAWPARPLRFIVPYTPGGFTDVTARLVAAKLQERLGQAVTIENKPGSNSIVGVDAVAKAAPDGYTFGVVIAAYAANSSLYPKLPYDPKKDLQAVSLIGLSPLVAAVNNNAPFRTVPELVAFAKARPGKLSFGSSGGGSAAHLTTEYT
jgi:tripartite-type tricarboxylate transporter receptor subunit TctC